MSDSQKDYEVGYGKPPKHGQFKKGKSGNPKGRPKGARALKHDLKDELDELITITENGQEFTLSKQRVVLKQLVTKAAKGDIRSTQHLFGLAMALLNENGDEKEASHGLAEDDQAILEAFIAKQQEASDEQ